MNEFSCSNIENWVDFLPSFIQHLMYHFTHFSNVTWKSEKEEKNFRIIRKSYLGKSLFLFFLEMTTLTCSLILILQNENFSHLISYSTDFPSDFMKVKEEINFPFLEQFDIEFSFNELWYCWGNSFPIHPLFLSFCYFLCFLFELSWDNLTLFLFMNFSLGFCGKISL